MVFNGAVLVSGVDGLMVGWIVWVLGWTKLSREGYDRLDDRVGALNCDSRGNEVALAGGVAI